jgi:hypothetical protein
MFSGRYSGEMFLTIEVRRQRGMICNASEGIKTDPVNHKLTLGKELEGEALE